MCGGKGSCGTILQIVSDQNGILLRLGGRGWSLLRLLNTRVGHIDNLDLPRFVERLGKTRMSFVGWEQP